MFFLFDPATTHKVTSTQAERPNHPSRYHAKQGGGSGGGGFLHDNDDAVVTPQGRPDLVALGLKKYKRFCKLNDHG